MGSQQETKSTSNGGQHEQCANISSRVLGETTIDDGTGTDPNHDQNTLWDTKKSGVKRVYE